MNDFEKALQNLDRSVAELKRYRTEAGRKPELLSEWTKTLERTTRTLEQVTAQIDSGKIPVENLSYEQKIIRGLKEQVSYLNTKIADLENDVKEKTAQLNRFVIDSLPTDGTLSDELNGYELKKDFYPLCDNLKKSLENRFPRADSTQQEIDDFSEYLRLAFLRGADARTNALKNALDERYGQFIEEYDKFIDALYDPQRGGRLFGEFGLYLLDLNDEARQKLFKVDGSYLNDVTVGGRPVKYYDDKRTYVACRGEITYRHTQKIDVLFPGFCARCRNSDDIWLLIPPYIYQRPDDKTNISERSADYER